MRVDLYTKVVLTVIALVLTGIFGNLVLKPSPVSAQGSVDYSRLIVSASGNQLVVYNTFDGNVDVLDLNSGKHIRNWRIGDPAYDLYRGN